MLDGLFLVNNVWIMILVLKMHSKMRGALSLMLFNLKTHEKNGRIGKF